MPNFISIAQTTPEQSRENRLGSWEKGQCPRIVFEIRCRVENAYRKLVERVKNSDRDWKKAEN